jgi:Ca2+-binding RTX toxin-like protein
MTRKALVVLATTVGVLCVVPSADAFTTLPVWKCRASPLYTSVSGNNRVEPIVANGNINTANGADPDHAQCADAETGAGNTATQLAIPQNTIGASTTQAKTTITPELGKAIDQKVLSEAKAENLQVAIPAGSPSLLGVKAATSSVTASCTPGSLTPVLTGTSQVADLTVLGVPVPLDGLLTALTNALNPLDAIVDVKLNEKIPGSDGSLTVRALHVKVIQGTTPLIDLVVAETKAGYSGPVCDPTKQTPETPGGGQVCPNGSVLDLASNFCVIKEGGVIGSGQPDIIVGRPFQGPSGGTVVALPIARKKYGNSACLSGNGAPKFAIIGTNKADRITGTNVADRIIGLGGNDKLDGGRGNDCIEGRTGGDTMSGGLGNDKEYGSSGKDHLNGGPGTDYLSGGDSADTISASFGRDKVLGGSGVDFINIATAGPAASADCGSGRDKIRLNRNETKKIKHCETVYIFKDK